MIKDKSRIAAGALPSETYAKLIDQAYAKYRASPEYSAKNVVLFPVFDAGGWVRLGDMVRILGALLDMGDAGEPLFWIKVVALGEGAYPRCIQVHIYRTESVDTSHGIAWINITTFNKVRIDRMESILKKGAVLSERNIADIRRLLLDA